MTTIFNDLKSRIKEINPWKKEVELEISVEDTNREWARILTAHASRVKLPGFRPGRAPQDLVKRLFYQELRERLFESLAPKALAEALRAQNINPVGLPVIQDWSYEEGTPLRLRANFEVWPEFELPDLKKIRVKERKVVVEEKEIIQSLEEIRMKTAEYIPVKGRGVAEGDYVVVELKGRDKNTKRLLPTEKVAILAGHKENEPIINEKLLGLRIGEEGEFSISYSKDYHEKRLAGREVEYRFKVLAIKEKKIPELNDDFAKDLGEFTGLQDLKEKIRQEILKSKERDARNEIAEELLDKIAEAVKVDLPEDLVEREALELAKKSISANEDRLESLDFELLKAEKRRQAAERIKKRLILKKVAAREGLKVTEGEVDREIESLARANSIPLPKLMESFSREGRRENLRESLLLKKAVDFLLQQAIIE